MAYSYEIYSGVAADQTYTIPFNYLDESHVFVTVDDVAADITVAGSVATIVTPAIAGGEVIRVYRVTPRGDNERLVDFVSGSSVTANNLDNSALQLLYIIQESLDAGTSSGGGGGTALGLNNTETAWDANALRVTNGSPAADPSDLVTFQQLLDAEILAGQLPTVSTTDNNSTLTVQAGDWTTTTPANARTALGLGTAAVANTGVTVGTVPVLAADGELAAGIAGTNLNISGNADILTILAALSKTTVGVVRYNSFTVLTDTAAGWATTSANSVPIVSLNAINENDDEFGTVSPGNGTIVLNADASDARQYLVWLYCTIQVDDSSAVSSTFTADSGTDILTYSVIDIPNATRIRVTNSGGNLPNPLVEDTDYWTIRQSATTSKLATSHADAIAATAINLTTNGTGTSTIVDTFGASMDPILKFALMDTGTGVAVGNITNASPYQTIHRNPNGKTEFFLTGVGLCSVAAGVPVTLVLRLANHNSVSSTGALALNALQNGGRMILVRIT